MTPPIVREHGGVSVIREDLFPGGTKARFMPVLFEIAREAVYASPAEGGAKTEFRISIAPIKAEINRSS